MLTRNQALQLEAGIGNSSILHNRTHKVSIFFLFLQVQHIIGFAMSAYASCSFFLQLDEV